MRSGHITASGRFLNLLVLMKRYIDRHLSCQSFCFTEDRNGKTHPKDVPKGFVAVYVGNNQEEQARFVIPVLYFNHPLFFHLLQEAEQFYGFHQKGVLAIPCQISEFEYLQWHIDRRRDQSVATIDHPILLPI